jgi:hypothetical protein
MCDVEKVGYLWGALGLFPAVFVTGIERVGSRR